MTAIDNVTLSLAGVATVTVSSTKVEDYWTNQLTTTFSTPTTSNTNSTGTKVGNLLKIVEKITVTGYLATGVGASDTHPNAHDKKADLKLLFNNRKSCTLTWDTDTYTGVIDTLKITDNTLFTGAEAPDGVARFEILLTFIVSTNLIPTT